MATFPPSRAEALHRLAEFLPRAGRDYAATRNADAGPDDRANVSNLSPYLRYRMITEPEVIEALHERHSASAAAKFVQEVGWRTYWKGWLELRPEAWSRFLAERDAARDSPAALLRAVQQAEAGATGIEGFDDWAHELTTYGYLHNHARMWFASIWVFTLRLPWTLGADFFLRHLVDADPASNTLSWRWVAGLQTPGKTYLATADNIARYTGGRFPPRGLATRAEALTSVATSADAGPVATCLAAAACGGFVAGKPGAERCRSSWRAAAAIGGRLALGRQGRRLRSGCTSRLRYPHCGSLRLRRTLSGASRNRCCRVRGRCQACANSLCSRRPNGG